MHGIPHNTMLISTFLGTFPGNNCEKRTLTGEHNTPPGFVQQPTCFQLCSAFSSGIQSHISCPCSSQHCSRYSQYGPHVIPHLQQRVRQNNKRYIKIRWDKNNVVFKFSFSGIILLTDIFYKVYILHPLQNVRIKRNR